MERENRTLFPLLAKPLSRTQLCWAVSRLWIAAASPSFAFIRLLRHPFRTREPSLAPAQLVAGASAPLGDAGGGDLRHIALASLSSPAVSTPPSPLSC